MPNSNEDQQLSAFTFFRSYYEAAQELKDKERLALYDAIIRFCFEGEEPGVGGTAKAMFLLCKPNLKKSIARTKAGANGGKAKPKQKPSKPQANDNEPPSDKDKDVGDRSEDGDVGEEAGASSATTGGGEAPQPRADAVPYAKIQEAYNATCTRLSRIKAIESNRRKAVSARCKTHGMDGILAVFDKVAASEFLNGNNDRNWKADFDWVMEANHFVKILEGKYDGPTVSAQQQPQTANGTLGRLNQIIAQGEGGNYGQ